jgi:hypothetical protein
MTDTTSLTIAAQQVHFTVPIEIAWIIGAVLLMGVMQIAFTLLEWRDSLKATLTRWMP